MSKKIEYLEDERIYDKNGKLEAVIVPSNKYIQDKVNEIIEEMKKQKFTSCYLISKFGH